MTNTNPHPFANPLNSGFYARRGTAFRPAGSNPSRLTVPDAKPAEYSADGLTVPNQDTPPGDQLYGNGFIDSTTNMFRLSDGTIINFDTGRIICGRRQSDEYWEGGVRVIQRGLHAGTSHSDSISMSDLINNVDYYNGTAAPDGQILEPPDAVSLEYWRKAAAEANRLISSMTDEQKMSLAQFEKHFPPSKFTDEP